MVALGTKAECLQACELEGLGLAVGPGRACYVPIGGAWGLDAGAVGEALRGALEDDSLVKVGEGCGATSRAPTARVGERASAATSR